MRIIGGSAKGTKLKVASEGTRPSTDRTRESLFSILQFILKDAIVLDLFSGSGALGLEAISRGAKSATLIEKDRKAAQTIRENIRQCQFLNCAVNEEEVHRYLKKMNKVVTLCFADPPYENKFKGSQLELVLTSPELHQNTSADGYLITESPQSLKDNEFALWKIEKTKKFGKSHVTIFQKK